MNLPLSSIRLIVGIGNPGQEYKHTYHNAGALTLQICARRDGAPEFQKAPRKHFTYAKGAHFIFVRSLTFMNESGIAVREACAFFKVPPEAVAVMHDESDLPLGTFQYAFGKGAAGHKGVLSATEALGTENFWRIRIGIRPHKEHTRQKAGAFVLTSISREDQKKLARVAEEIADLLLS